MSLILKNLAPTGVRGMKVLDRNKFMQELSVPVLEVHTKKFNEVVKCLRKYFLKLHHFKPMQDIEVSDNTDKINKIIYLDPEKLKQWSDIKKEDQIILNSYAITDTNLREENVKISYINWSANHIFSAVLPEGSETCSGYEQVGHIIHLNLRDHLSEYRHLIGEVLLDKVKTCETVVTKTDSIDNQFRFFKMEVIAGRDDFIVTVKENNCTFKFDFSKVYWNSRLTAEHERIIKKVKPEDILFDIFAGVGPFSIPAARCRKATVYANDLNPESYNWLVSNSKLNKVNLSQFTAYNLDGEVFIKDSFKKFLVDVCRGTTTLVPDAKIYITMNLPSFSYQFLKHFVGLLTNEDISLLINEIIIHYYCFTLKTDSVAEAKKQLTDNLEFDLESCVMEVIMVRDVSPSKSMMRVTFRLPKSVLSKKDNDSVSEPPNKKVCVESALNETTMQLADEHHHVAMDTSQPNYLDVLKEAENILTKCFTDYSPEEIFLSFNGGKDCTVLLDITINVLKKLLNTTSIGEHLNVVYIQTDSPFRELEKFVNLIQKHYGLNLVTEKGDLKVTLEKILSSNNKLKACLMGTRKTDPYCDNMQCVQKTDPSWPEIVRVSPLLNWSYHQIWSYILTNQVPYCSLYDQGYTSIGSTHNTEPNPALLNHTTKPPTYLPAWKLSDGSLERAGRTKKQENAINGKHGVTDSCHSLNSCQIQNGSCTTLKLDL